MPKNAIRCENNVRHMFLNAIFNPCIVNVCYDSVQQLSADHSNLSKNGFFFESFNICDLSTYVYVKISLNKDNANGKIGIAREPGQASKTRDKAFCKDHVVERIY